MKLPRDLSGNDLARRLVSLGYAITRQTGSHMRLTTNRGGEHHITIPAHARSALARSTPFCERSSGTTV